MTHSFPFRVFSVFLIVVPFLLGPRSGMAQFRDVGYTFEPTVQGIGEGHAAPFQNDPLYGGSLGLNFGRHFQASAEYLVNTGLETDFANVGRLQGLLNRDLELRRYGGRIRFNLYDRRVLPYLTAGTGILQFDPEGVDASRTIYASAGGGITFSAYDRYRISIGGEVMRYRYDPVASFLGPTGAATFETGTVLVSSPVLNASVSFFLGGRSLEEQTVVDRALREQFGGRGFLRGVRLFVNPFYGRVEFNDALGFPKDQNLTGVNAGLSLGPYIGLRGFYWRGTTGNRVTADFADGFERIAMYGGELQFRLNLGLGQGFVPYAKVGGGYLDVLRGYASALPAGASVPEDRFFGLSGLGLEVPLTQSIKLSGGARGLLMSNPNAVEAGDPGNLYGSLMYSAGIEFRIGGSERKRPTMDPEEGAGPTMPLPTADADTMQGETPGAPSMTETEQRLLARADSLETALQALRDKPQAEAVDPSGQPVDPSVSTQRRSNVSEKTMTVPVPETGELYIRFGDGTGSTTGAPARTEPRSQPVNTRSDLEERLRETLRQELEQQTESDTAETLTSADIERLVERTLRTALDRRAEAAAREQTDVGQRRQEAPLRQQDADRQQREAQDRQIQELQKQLEALRRELREEATEPPPTSRVQIRSTSSQPFYRQTLGRPLTYLVPIAGFRAGDGPDQMHVGVRGDYRLNPTSRLQLLPELSFGLGAGHTISPTILFNAAYSFWRDATPALTGAPIEPYAGIGLGIASAGGFTFEPVTNVMVGFNYRFEGGRALFLEYSTLDFLDTHRVHLGTRIPL